MHTTCRGDHLEAIRLLRGQKSRARAPSHFLTSTGNGNTWAEGAKPGSANTACSSAFCPAPFCSLLTQDTALLLFFPTRVPAIQLLSLACSPSLISFRGRKFSGKVSYPPLEAMLQEEMENRLTKPPIWSLTLGSRLLENVCRHGCLGRLIPRTFRVVWYLGGKG